MIFSMTLSNLVFMFRHTKFVIIRFYNIVLILFFSTYITTNIGVNKFYEQNVKYGS